MKASELLREVEGIRLHKPINPDSGPDYSPDPRLMTRKRYRHASRQWLRRHKIVAIYTSRTKP